MRNGLGPLLPAMAMLVALGGGCTSMKNMLAGPPPVTVAEVVSMSRAGVPASEIIDEMQRSGTVYRLSASQLADLRNQGVSDDVIDYMQKSYLESVAADAAFESYDPWTLEDDGFWYGGGPYGWPDEVWVRGGRR